MANFYTDNEDLKFHLGHPLMQKIVALKERNFEDAGTVSYTHLVQSGREKLVAEKNQHTAHRLQEVVSSVKSDKRAAV